tara:strand:+ start:25873 stop:26985 length:1113 start_codon:yes stop_codon:yes gene_type:complete
MDNIYISGTGLWKPESSITNEEIVKSFNAYVDNFNNINKDAIDKGDLDPLIHSSCEFIEKASGIKNRYVIEKQGLLDPDNMKPKIPARNIDDLSILAEISVKASKEAITNAGIETSDIDAVIVSAANISRAYPAIAIEVQNELGIDGYGYDMMVACSSTTFGISNAYADIKAGKANTILVVNPEITTAHNNNKSRESHFIFGDVCTASIIQKNSSSDNKFKIIDTRLKTVFSNNIRNEFGFINFIEDKDYEEDELLFKQNGRAVFKEVCPMVAELITNHLLDHNIEPKDVTQYWLHQANINMNNFILKKILGDDIDPKLAPNVLEEYANTGSAGSLIAFHTNNILRKGDKGVICSFGGGYSICSIIVEKD